MLTRSQGRRSGAANTLQHYRKSEAISAVSAGSRGSTAVSWQRLRPLPIPTQQDDSGGGPIRNSVAEASRRCQPAASDSQQPLLSPMSLDVGHVRTVSYGVRESAFPFSAASNRRRQIEAADVSSSGLSFGRGPSAAWLSAPEHPPPLPPPLQQQQPNSGNTNADADAGSPYYFKLDPALTQKNRRMRAGNERIPAEAWEQLNRSRWSECQRAQPSNITGCFMCDANDMP